MAGMDLTSHGGLACAYYDEHDTQGKKKKKKILYDDKGIFFGCLI
jgi:hypothetical protein